MSQQFEYDEQGATFLYFVLSVLVMILCPLTYVFWPRGNKEEEDRLKSLCRVHGQSKWYKKSQKLLQAKKYRPAIKKMLFLFGWLCLFFIMYKVSRVENTHVEYNPYKVLGIDEDATEKQIKKRYRQLSKENHPDKGGDQEVFIAISKAYNSLVDAETRENWQKYGNPDGPQATQFGIALPKWIFESNNSMIVIGVYFMIFMVGLPIMVGRWWYRSIRYSKEEVLLNTTQLFLYFLNKTTNMNLKRALLVLSSAFEFSHEHCSKVRAPTPKDNEDLPELLRQLDIHYNVVENAKEKPMNYPYSIKARALMNSHLVNLDIFSQNLANDLDYVLIKSSLLVQEMINCIAQLTVMANYNKAQKPRLDSLENVMKLGPMMVQGIKENKSPLLQLPYFNDDYVKYCVTSKKHSGVKNLRNLAALGGSDRKQLLRRMGDECYETMTTVLRMIPEVDLSAQIHIIDDEETSNITSGAIVTVTLKMTRRSLGEVFPEEEVTEDKDESGDEAEQLLEKGENTQVKLKPWEKQTKQKKKKKKVVNKKQQVKKTVSAPKKEEKVSDEETNGDEENVAESQVEEVSQEAKEEEEWNKLQESLKKKEKIALEGIDKQTHTVYAPRYPQEKQEWWWVYMCDR